ncbi:MAG: chemotaxis protein CheW [Nitrospira sp.]|nr:chemotaxis protein CheW [Nitrospira sp.]
MLRAQLRKQSPTGSTGATEARIQNMVVFSVAGQRFAARTDEIGGVTPWPGATTVPSDTPFIDSLVRHEKGCLPVFDLAAKFHRAMRDGERLCLIVKHVDGPLAICIDAHVPSLHMVARSLIQYRDGNDPDIAGTCIAGEEELPIINLTTLGVSSNRFAR